MSVPAPFLWVIAGPNGSGKTTYWERQVRTRLQLPFVNADHIAREIWPGAEADHAYDAAALAARRRASLIETRASFVAETVFSHESKLAMLDDARARGYVVWLTFIALEAPDLAIARVAERVAAGGHAVPPDKIVARFHRAVAHAREAIARVDKLFVVDNSEPTTAHRVILRFDLGRLTWVNATVSVLPRWVIQSFGDLIDSRG